MALFEIPTVQKTTFPHEGFFKVRVDQLHFADRGVTSEHSTVDLGVDAVMVLATTKEGRYVINREYRHSCAKTLYGCPGGRVDPGEDRLLAAKRELLEETGYEATEWHAMGSAHPFPGVCGQEVFFYRAMNAVRVSDPSPDPAESFETIELEEERLRELMKKGGNNDGLLLLAMGLEQVFGLA